LLTNSIAIYGSEKIRPVRKINQNKELKSFTGLYPNAFITGSDRR